MNHLSYIQQNLPQRRLNNYPIKSKTDLHMFPQEQTRASGAFLTFLPFPTQWGPQTMHMLCHLLSRVSLSPRKASQDSLIEQRHGGSPLALLDHVGLIPQGDPNHGGCQPTRLPIYLHGDGLVSQKHHFPTLVQPFSMAPNLQGSLSKQGKEEPRVSG